MATAVIKDERAGNFTMGKSPRRGARAHWPYPALRIPTFLASPTPHAVSHFSYSSGVHATPLLWHAEDTPMRRLLNALPVLTKMAKPGPSVAPAGTKRKPQPLHEEDLREEEPKKAYKDMTIDDFEAKQAHYFKFLDHHTKLFEDELVALLKKNSSSSIPGTQELKKMASEASGMEEEEEEAGQADAEGAT